MNFFGSDLVRILVYYAVLTWAVYNSKSSRFNGQNFYRPLNLWYIENMNIFKHLPTKVAYAHCDIPCGIYDPFRAQQAAHTVIRMTELLSKVDRKDETKAEHDIARITRVKEKHGEIVEDELGTLQNDYFKKEHYKEYPSLAELLSETVKSSIAARQNISMEAAEATLKGVLEIAEIFFRTKGVEPVRVKSVYPTEREVVLHR